MLDNRLTITETKLVSTKLERTWNYPKGYYHRLEQRKKKLKLLLYVFQRTHL
jgi:hypothetical protein